MEEEPRLGADNRGVRRGRGVRGVPLRVRARRVEVGLGSGRGTSGVSEEGGPPKRLEEWGVRSSGTPDFLIPRPLFSVGRLRRARSSSPIVPLTSRLVPFRLSSSEVRRPTQGEG